MSVQARRKREKEQRKQLIRECAKDIFRKKGFNGTTIRDLAQACELATGTIYLYYHDKNELLADLLVEGHALLIEKLEHVIESTPPALQLEKLIDVFLEFATTSPEYFELMFFVVQREGHSILDVVPKEGTTYQELQRQQQHCLQLAATAIRNRGGNADERKIFLTSEAAWSMMAGVVFFFRKEGTELFTPVSLQAKEMLLNCLNR